jgi:hypothetical protein
VRPAPEVQPLQLLPHPTFGPLSNTSNRRVGTAFPSKSRNSLCLVSWTIIISALFMVGLHDTESLVGTDVTCPKKSRLCPRWRRRLFSGRQPRSRLLSRSRHLEPEPLAQQFGTFVETIHRSVFFVLRSTASAFGNIVGIPSANVRQAAAKWSSIYEPKSTLEIIRALIRHLAIHRTLLDCPLFSESTAAYLTPTLLRPAP